jgi:hypothetical protein
MELSAGALPRQRKEIGSLMMELSKGRTMLAMSESLLEAEVDLALKKRTGRPFQPRRVQVFGTGIGHALGHPDFKGRIVDLEGNRPPSLSPELLRLELELQQLSELYLLTGPPGDPTIPGYDPKAHTKFDRTFAEEEEKFAAAMSDMPRAKHTDMLMARIWVQDVLPAVINSLKYAGLPMEAVSLDTKAELTSFLRDVPSAWTLTEMRRLRHANPQQHWRPQDHADLRFLTVALNHCDAVMPDKAWATLARQAQLPHAEERCTILSKPMDLLIELSRPPTEE